MACFILLCGLIKAHLCWCPKFIFTDDPLCLHCPRSGQVACRQPCSPLPWDCRFGFVTFRRCMQHGLQIQLRHCSAWRNFLPKRAFVSSSCTLPGTNFPHVMKKVFPFQLINICFTNWFSKVELKLPSWGSLHGIWLFCRPMSLLSIDTQILKPVW